MGKLYKLIESDDSFVDEWSHSELDTVKETADNWRIFGVGTNLSYLSKWSPVNDTTSNIILKRKFTDGSEQLIMEVNV